VWISSRLSANRAILDGKLLAAQGKFSGAGCICRFSPDDKKLFVLPRGQMVYGLDTAAYKLE
jgi:hypothetical protein